MTRTQNFSYPSADGKSTIQAREWLPEGSPRGVVQIIHGISEHMGRYDHVARFLNENGFLVCGEDHLGHGRTVSDGRYGYFAARGGWDFVVRDIRRLREIEGEKYPGIPYFLMGHSMGSFLARTYLIRWPGTVDGAVLSGTGQEAAPLVAFGRGASNLLCALCGPEHVSGLIYRLSLGSYSRPFRRDGGTGSWLSQDPEMVESNRRDPLCSFRPTVSMFRDMMEGLEFIGSGSNLAKMDPETPIYFFSGDRDPVGSMGKGVRKVEEMFRRAGCRDVTVRLYPGGRHEMLNEINRSEVLEDLLAWLEKHML